MTGVSTPHCVTSFDQGVTCNENNNYCLYRDNCDADDMMAIMDELNSDWEASQERVLDLRFELKASMSEEEWAAVFEAK